MASTKTTLRSLTLRCPECGCDAAMIVNTGDLTTVECADCGESFAPSAAVEAAREAAARWERFAAWIEAAAAV